MGLCDLPVFVFVAQWTLNQVQGDGFGLGATFPLNCHPELVSGPIYQPLPEQPI